MLYAVSAERRRATRRPAGFLLHMAGAQPVRHRTLLGALKVGATLAQDGGRDVRVEDLGRGIAWRAVRIRRSRTATGP